jgi:GT2 family glycosyltransferase
MSSPRVTQRDAAPVIRLAILTHNARPFSQRCLESLIAHTPAEHDISILDNGSNDGTREWLASRWAPNLHVMLSPVNLGVPKGRNLLLASILARARPSDFIVFLDNDVEALAGWYEPFVALFAEETAVGVAGVTGHDIIVGEEHRELLPSPDHGSAEVDVVSGYCLWVTAAAAAIGPFDENLGLFWHEDDDYCVRAIGLGLRVIALPGTSIVHHRHKSGVAEQPEFESISLRNQQYLVEKWRRVGLVNSRGRIGPRGCASR